MKLPELMILVDTETFRSEKRAWRICVQCRTVLYPAAGVTPIIRQEPSLLYTVIEIDQVAVSITCKMFLNVRGSCKCTQGVGNCEIYIIICT